MSKLELYTAGVRGRVSRSHYFVCGACANVTDFNFRRQSDATRKARAAGWRLFRLLGWVCPACIHTSACQECETSGECMVGYGLRHR